MQNEPEVEEEPEPERNAQTECVKVCARVAERMVVCRNQVMRNRNAVAGMRETTVRGSNARSVARVRRQTAKNAAKNQHGREREA